MPNHRPVIFLAFANDREDNAKYLRNIPAEHNEIRKILIHAQERNICDYEILAYATFKDIKDVLTSEKYRNRIVAFHFGGHADGFQLLLERESGMNHLANGENLSNYFKILKEGNVQANLQLLFFNGCCTEIFAQRLQSIIPAVIATDNEINDEQAKSLAVNFYDNLCKKITIQTSFALAKTETTIDNGNDVRGLYRKGVSKEPHDAPWNLYGNEIGAKWVIGVEDIGSQNINLQIGTGNTKININMDLQEFKKQLISMIEEANYDEFFKQLRDSNFVYDKAMLNRLKKEYEFGRYDFDFLNRLKSFANGVKR